jgi:hypothetical protein
LKNTLFIFFILFWVSYTQAQHITFCKAYTESGDPIDLIYPKELSFNQSVCILLNAGNKKISESSVFLFIDRVTESGEQNQFNKMIHVEKDKNWIAQTYKFIKDGKFDIYFSDANQNRLASVSVNIKSAKELKSSTVISSSIYPNAEIILCEKILDGFPINVKRSISLQKESNTIYIYLKNDLPLETEKISVRLFRRSKYSLDYDEFVSSKKFQINKDWADAYFKYKFDKPGEYKINVHDEKELLIKTGYISVVN